MITPDLYINQLTIRLVVIIIFVCKLCINIERSILEQKIYHHVIIYVYRNMIQPE